MNSHLRYFKGFNNCYILLLNFGKPLKTLKSLWVSFLSHVVSCYIFLPLFTNPHIVQHHTDFKGNQAVLMSRRSDLGMENKNKDTIFKYTYSAKEQDEIRRIRQKYQAQKEDGISRLRKLDAKVSQKATMVSLVLGVVGALVMGSGMSLIMTDMGEILEVTGIVGMFVGIFIGVIGIILIALAYPVYSKVLEKEREKIAPEILRLTEELLK